MTTMALVGTAPPPGPDLASTWEDVAEAFRRWHEHGASADALVTLMTPILWQVARACRLPEDLARDVVQESWLALVRHRDAIESPRAVAAWLITTTRRGAWRARTRLDAAGVDVPDDTLERALPSAEPAEDVALARVDRERLWRAVGRLTQRCQMLLRVVAFSPRPDYASLSQTLGMPIGSIGPTRGRCLEKLRAELASSGGPAWEAGR